MRRSEVACSTRRAISGVSQNAWMDTRGSGAITVSAAGWAEGGVWPPSRSFMPLTPSRRR
ncbi:hypothetical protein [Chenggangzhangella methanolivorans]|uniref:hypothetical protein n=1 Tax=Chenggangzhangella methanolivorans TaxID=1437009 RepID=UPI0021BDD274|nr:hypothetical protein [Chenggangzhangella methanolivorans]